MLCLRRLLALCLAAAFGAGCSSSGLSGGARSKGSTRDSGQTEEKTDEGGSGKQTGTGTEQEIGADDSGDFAFPEDVAGSYLTCVAVSASAGKAEFACGVHKNGQPDPRILSAVKQGTLLGLEALKVATLDAQLDQSPGKIRVTLTGTGQVPAAQVPFGLAIEAAFADGTTSTLNSPFALFIPDAVFGKASCPAGYVGDAKVLADGRTFKVCTSSGGGGGTIEALWTKFPGTDESQYVASFVPESAAGICDTFQKVSANFQACSCEISDAWIKGTVNLTNGNPFSSPDICLHVETSVMIFGKTKAIFSTSH